MYHQKRIGGCHQRNTLRYIWHTHRIEVNHSKNTMDRIFMVVNDQRYEHLHSKMIGFLDTFKLSYSSTYRVNKNHMSMAFLSMGDWHSGTFSGSTTKVKVLNCGCWLFHQMCQGRSISSNLREKCIEVHLETNRLPLWSPIHNH